MEGNLRGSLITHLRETLDLPDDCQIPEFLFDVAMDDLNEILEKHFFEKMLFVMEK